MKFKIPLFAAFIFVLNMDARAQLVWNQNIDTDKINISLEWGKPIFEENDKVGSSQKSGHVEWLQLNSIFN